MDSNVSGVAALQPVVR